MYLITFMPKDKESIARSAKKTKTVIDHHISFLFATVCAFALFKFAIQSMLPSLITSVAIVITFFFFGDKLLSAFRERIGNKVANLCK
jgi:hypothetical protein